MHPTIKVDNKIDVLLSFFKENNTVSIETLTMLFKIETANEEIATKLQTILMEEYLNHRGKKLAYPLDLLQILASPTMSQFKFVCVKADKYKDTLQLNYKGNLHTVKRYDVQEVNGYPYLYMYIDSFFLTNVVVSFTSEVSTQLGIVLEQLDYCAKEGKMVTIHEDPTNGQIFMLNVKGAYFRYTVNTSTY